jgi:putative ABC transport system permease protein
MMTWRDSILTAFDAVRTHRLRSVLTMLGILIGIVAVILSVGLGQGAQAQVQADINQLGTNVLVVSPGSATSSTGSRGGFGSASTLTFQNAQALVNSPAAPDVEAVAPVSTANVSVTYETTNWTTQLLGTTPAWRTVRSRELLAGRFITDVDEATAAPVVVLGPDTATQLFTSGNPIGQSITYNGTQLQVVGILAPLSSNEATSNNDLVVVPYSTYAQRLVGGTSRNAVSSIYVKATGSGTLSGAYQETQDLLLNLHGITTPTSADFSIATQQSILSAANKVDTTMALMLGGIAIISLLVGGIGVMNIMLVSVTERIPEIGLRKALGARPGVIRRQFLLEASILGLAGGLIGVGLGILGAVVIPHFVATRIEISIPAAIAGVFVAILIGISFGVYPATRAARLAPIDALRND